MLELLRGEGAVSYAKPLVETPPTGALFVRLNRPDALNALNSKPMTEILAVLDAAEADPHAGDGDARGSAPRRLQALMQQVGRSVLGLRAPTCVHRRAARPL